MKLNYKNFLVKIHMLKKQMPNCHTVNTLPGKNPHGKETDAKLPNSKILSLAKMHMAKKQMPNSKILSLAKIHMAKKQMPNCQTVNTLSGKDSHGKDADAKLPNSKYSPWQKFTWQRNRSTALSNTNSTLSQRQGIH